MRIVLIDDHAATRDEMRGLIELQPDMRVVAEAATGEDGLAAARAELPDVVIMDIWLPGISGIEATRRLLAERPGTKVLALSNHTGEILVNTILDAGCQGYVMKEVAFEELIPALRAIAAGRQYVSTRP